MENRYLNGLRNNIKLYYITTAFSGLLYTIPVWVAFHQRFLTYSQIANLVALSYFVTLILELPSGALADLIGRKKVITMGYFCIGLFSVLLGFAGSPLVFYVGWMGGAVGNALISGSDTALLYDSLKGMKEESKFARIVAKGAFGRKLLLVVAVFSGGYLYNVFIGLPYVLRGGAYFFMAMITLMIVEPKINTYRFSMKNYIIQTKEGVLHLYRRVDTRALAAYYAIVVGVILVLQEYFVNTFAKDSGYTEKEQSWAFASFYLISAIVVIFLTKNKESMPKKNTIYVLVPLLLITALIPGYFASKMVVYVLILAVNIASALKGALLDNYVNEEIDSKYRATSMSALNLGVSGVYILILLVTGPLQDLYSNRLVWSLIGVGSLLLMVPITWLLVRRGRLQV